MALSRPRPLSRPAIVLDWILEHVGLPIPVIRQLLIQLKIVCVRHLDRQPTRPFGVIAQTQYLCDAIPLAGHC
jgi:hypothetical protein